MSPLPSDRAVDTLMRADPEFVELVETLYGPGVDADAVWRDVFGKLNGPDSSAVHIPGAPSPGRQRRRKAFALAALGSTAAGAAVAGKQLVASSGRGRIVPGVALAGDALAGGELWQHLKTVVGSNSQSQPVSKTSLSQLVRGSLTQHRRLVRVTMDATKPVEAAGRRYTDRGPAQLRPTVAKRLEADWTGTFSKLRPEKRVALGWASVCKVNGVPVVDKQGDYIDANDLEDAVYAYVQRSRVGGDMHERQATGVRKSNGRGLWFGLYDPVADEPRQVADLVESVIITKEKKTAMGLPEEFPEGWWVGFRYHDDQVWGAIKKGDRRGFSIHGTGLRAAVDYDQLMGVG